MKKLLITGSTFPRWENDTEPRFILDYAKAMSQYYDVTVLVPAAVGAKENEVMEGVKVRRFHYFPIHKWETLCYPGAIVPRIREKKIRLFLVPFLLLSMYFTLRKICTGFDVVHAHWLIPQGIIQSFIKGTPYVITGHGGDVTSINNAIFKKLKVRCLRKAAKVTVVSEHLKEKTQELLPDICPEVISMGVDTSKFGKKYIVQNYFEQGQKRVVLFVGRLAEKKGVTYLIEAMRQVDNAILVIVGKGSLEKSLQKQAVDMGEKIIFWGAKTHIELSSIFASADVLVVPSITAKDGDQEGLPTVILEAMASELPIVASDIGGISQLICNNKNGLLCEQKNSGQIAEKINQLLLDSDLCKKLARNAKLTSEMFDYTKISARYKDVLADAVFCEN